MAERGGAAQCSVAAGRFGLIRQSSDIIGAAIDPDSVMKRTKIMFTLRG